MKRLHYIICLFSLIVSGMQAQVKQQQTSIKPVGDRLVLKTVFVLDELRQRSNQQTVYTPILEGKDGQTVLFKSLMVNGRRQHLYYMRNGNSVTSLGLILIEVKDWISITLPEIQM